MTLIDTSKWIKFRCENLFECKNTGNILARDVIDGSGQTPYVTASAFNNGVAAYIDANGYEIIKGDCILVGGKTFTITYQKEDFVSNDSHNFVIRVKDYDISERSYLYLVSMIYTYFGQKYSWSDAVTKDKFLSEEIPLPSTSDGKPDWEFMDSYMKRIMKESEESLENLRRAESSKHIVDVSEWKEFGITDFFDLSLPKGDLQVKKVEEGDIMLITPSNSNNGLLQRISADSKSTRYKANSLTVDMFGNAYYHAEDFFVTAHGHVNVLLPKVTINEYTGKFIATAIRTMFLDKYGFSEMCTLKVLKAESIRLPVTRKGDPDWHYMEDYMKGIIKQAEESLSALKIGA